MACNKCKEKKCLCSDHPLTIPPTFSNDPTVCPPDSETCSEVFDMKCVCYQGPDICQLDIKTGDRLEEVIRKILLSIGTLCTIPTNGIDGTDGTDGLDAVTTIEATNTLPSGSPATVTDSNPDPRIADLTFGIPEGPPGPGLNLDFDNPTTLLALDNTNVIFSTAFTALGYAKEAATNKYGEFRYWDVNSDLAYVQFFISFAANISPVGPANNTSIEDRYVNVASNIELTGLPFIPTTDDTYAVQATLTWNGVANTADFPNIFVADSTNTQGSDTIHCVGGGVNNLVFTSNPLYYVPAATCVNVGGLQYWTYFYSGYIFK